MKKVLLIVNSVVKDYSHIINEYMNKGCSIVVMPYKYAVIDNIEADLLLVEEYQLFNSKTYTTANIKDMLIDNAFNETVCFKLNLIIKYLEKNRNTKCLIGTIDAIMNNESIEITFESEEKVFSNVTIITDFYTRHNNLKYVAYVRDNRGFYVSGFVLKEGKMVLIDIDDEKVLNDLNIFSISLKIVLGIISRDYDLESIAKTVLDNCGFIIDGDNPNLQSIRKVISKEEKEVKIY